MRSQKENREDKAQEIVRYKMEILTILTTVAVGAAFLFAYRRGLRDGLAMNKGEVKTALEPLFKSPKFKREAKEQRRAKQIALNIENYKGTAEGQVKVK